LKKKIKVFTLSDHPLSPSGVGTQTKYVIESILKTGNFEVTSFGGAIKHEDYTPTKTEEYGEDWIIYPVDGYGNQEMVRSLIRQKKPDILWFMTDPRFWGWLWEMENEIRANIPMVYYHVWDNYPYPMFNKRYYDSNDLIVSISKVTDDLVKNVSPDVDRIYIPHAVNPHFFKKHDEKIIADFKKNSISERDKDKFIVFWNNRNARRKQTGSLIFWFKEFLDKVGHDKAMLLMHTDPKDPYGQDIETIMSELDLLDGQVMISRDKYPPELLSMLYNIADVTVNISDAEGFGLATLESLSCETPIIVTMTGGLQEQVTDGESWFGIGLEPVSKSIIGSQEVPYIYEDRVCKEDFINALEKIYNMTKEEREALGKAGRGHVEKNYGFDTFCNKWSTIMQSVHTNHGSWKARKNYKSYRIKEVL
jgi:glycosyltransferase involved in cell wall biosynthesis|tara:strand:+ start:106 stop:1368 length:1263 start_codon:yes stop_codon:yes gene_type:complete